MYRLFGKFIMYGISVISIFGLILMVLLSFIDSDLPEADRIMYRFIKKEGRKLEKKYNMSFSGIGGGGHPKINLMFLSFHLKTYPHTLEKARELIIHCIDDYLVAVNSDEGIRPHLENYPFTAKNIGLSIVLYDEKGRDVYDPWIDSVAAEEGLIGFFTSDKEKHLHCKFEKYETYDEAVAILKAQQQIDKTLTNP